MEIEDMGYLEFFNYFVIKFLKSAKYNTYKKHNEIYFSQERIKYYPDQAKFTYQSKYGKEVKEFGCLECMATLISHMPDIGGQNVSYYGRYSNVTRGRLKNWRVNSSSIEDESPGGLNRSWTRLIQKI